MEQINVGIIGLGEVAQIIHLPILQALSDRFRIRAVCDISPGLLQAVGNRYGIEHSDRYADPFALVQRSDVDAVFVLNSDEYHADCVIAAARSGKYVLVEKPMCLTLAEAEAIIRARDETGVQVMVAYMRRFAPAFEQAVAEVRALDTINYARIRDIIGRNRLIIDQSSVVLRFDDVPEEARLDRTARAERLVREAIGEAPPDIVGAYRFLLGLNSHDISAMRELLGMPQGVVSARHWNAGRFLTVVFAYDGYFAVLESGVDEQLRFDAHIEVYGVTKSVRVQYDSPYIRHLPTTLVINETVGDAYQQHVERPTFKDPYTHELEHFHEVVTTGAAPKTTPEDFIDDLHLMRQIVDTLRVEPALGNRA
ncbi:MAG TPA: Gfo/Idh/MocA family oxidoreductase [Thermomicrobiales bacterium]|nr:Gfo/Idh/MocA family oxidoreductase [Thermomicrobiales bacterium]